MAPSRELSAQFAAKDEVLDDIVMPMHSQALIPHPTITPLAAVVPAPLAAGMDFASILTGDFRNIKSLLTCSICDQLLYEPWTIACGHTYCYGCLTTWFEVNRRKKSCPECRSAVRHMPAPAFVIRQIVDIFVSRAEIMPAEESVEDHHRRRKEEREAVENDRNSVAGLFKGTFNGSHFTRILYDEADRIHRCGACGHEFVPGSNCENCGADFEGEEEAIQDDWSDDGDVDIDLEEIEYGYDEAEMDDEEFNSEDEDGDDDDGNIRNFLNGQMGAGLPMHPGLAFHAHRIQQNRLRRDYQDMFHNHLPPFQTVEEQSSDDEDAGSLNDFIAPEDEDEAINDSTPARPMFNRRHRHHIVPISSDDEREEGDEEDDDDTAPIQSRRRHRIRRSAVDEEDDNDDDNEDDDEEDDDEGFGAAPLPSRGRRARPQLDSDDSDSETAGNSGVSLNRAQRRSGRPTAEDSDSDAEPTEHNNMEDFGWSPLANGGESGDEENQEITCYGGYESAQEQSGNDTDNTLRIEEHDEESVQWDDEEVPDTDHEDRAPASRMLPVPDPPRRRRPWEEDPTPAHRRRGHQGGVQMGSAQMPISMDSDSSSSDDGDDYEGRDQDVEMSVSPSRTAATAESEDGESLGDAHDVHGDEDQSSEDSLQPPRQRRRLHRLEGSGEEYQHFGFGTRPVSNQNHYQSRSRHEPRVAHLTLSFDSRGAHLVSPSSRSHRRLQYSLNQPALELSNRAPRGYQYNPYLSPRSRPPNRHGMEYY